MKEYTLTISDISRFSAIQKRLAANKSLSRVDKSYLAGFLNQMPTIESVLMDKIPFDETFVARAWNNQKLEISLKRWRNLFAQTPGWNYTAFCYMVVPEDSEMLAQNVIAIAQFAPSMSHNLNDAKNGYEVWLKDDGTALFWLPTLEDVKQYPELYSFKGTWKEAYLILIETLQKGWPMEEFPEELKPFLKK